MSKDVRRPRFTFVQGKTVDCQKFSCVTLGKPIQINSCLKIAALFFMNYCDAQILLSDTGGGEKSNSSSESSGFRLSAQNYSILGLARLLLQDSQFEKSLRSLFRLWIQFLVMQGYHTYLPEKGTASRVLPSMFIWFLSLQCQSILRSLMHLFSHRETKWPSQVHTEMCDTNRN